MLRGEVAARVSQVVGALAAEGRQTAKQYSIKRHRGLRSGFGGRNSRGDLAAVISNSDQNSRKRHRRQCFGYECARVRSARVLTKKDR